VGSIPRSAHGRLMPEGVADLDKEEKRRRVSFGMSHATKFTVDLEDRFAVTPKSSNEAFHFVLPDLFDE